MSETKIAALFLDIGGVLLTNGWDHNSRKRAAAEFDVNFEEMNERHHLTFDAYEEGKLTLAEYLKRVVFHRNRPFTEQEFKTFMFHQSKPFPGMISLIEQIKTRYSLKTVTVSNEGRELTLFRVKEFRLDSVIDFFVSSCFVHFRKPDADIFRIALDCAQVAPEKVLYIDDRLMFVEVAADLGIRGIHHSGYESTRSALARLGLAAE